MKVRTLRLTQLAYRYSHQEPFRRSPGLQVSQVSSDRYTRNLGSPPRRDGKDGNWSRQEHHATRCPKSGRRL